MSIKPIKIRVIFPGPSNPGQQFRVVEDLLPYQDPGVELSLSYNTMGSLHGECDIEAALTTAGMALAAIEAEKDGVDAILIESMGDTGLIPCREAVNIPVVGLSDSTLRVAQMLGRKFGLITAGRWHGYFLERLMRSYGLDTQYVGFQALDLQPFVDFTDSEKGLSELVVQAVDRLVERDADTIVLGGSYFIGSEAKLVEALADERYKDLLVIDPLPLGIRFARMLVDARLSHSKRIYANPTRHTSVLGYTTIASTPGVA